MTKLLQYITIILFALASVLVGMDGYGQDTSNFKQIQTSLSFFYFSNLNMRYVVNPNGKESYYLKDSTGDHYVVGDTMQTIKDLFRCWAMEDSTVTHQRQEIQALKDIIFAWQKYSATLPNEAIKRIAKTVSAYNKLGNQ